MINAHTHINTLQNPMECVKIFSSWKIRRCYTPEDWPILLYQPASISITYHNYSIKKMPKQKVRSVHTLYTWSFLAIPFSNFEHNSRKISRKNKGNKKREKKQQINRNTEAAATNIRAGHHMLFTGIGSLNHRTRTHIFFAIYSLPPFNCWMPCWWRWVRRTRQYIFR